MNGPWVGGRVGLLRAADGPAPTIVVYGPGLTPALSRDEVLVAMAPVRDEVIRGHRATAGVGVKTVVVFAACDGEVRVEFFQGGPDGRVDPSVQLCLNSLLCGVTAVAAWTRAFPDPVVVRMGAGRYRLRSGAAATGTARR